MMSLVIIRASPFGISSDTAVWARTNPTSKQTQTLVRADKTENSGLHSRACRRAVGVTRVRPVGLLAVLAPAFDRVGRLDAESEFLVFG